MAFGAKAKSQKDGIEVFAGGYYHTVYPITICNQENWYSPKLYYIPVQRYLTCDILDGLGVAPATRPPVGAADPAPVRDGLCRLHLKPTP